MMELTGAFNVQLVDDLEAYFNNFGKEVKDVAEDVAKEIQPNFEDELKFYPPELPNQKYIRTNRLRDETALAYRVDESGITWQLGSGAPYDPYVRGTFNQRSRREATRSIAKIHRDRWVPLFDITRFWFEATAEQFTARFREQYRDFVKTTMKRRSKIR